MGTRNLTCVVEDGEFKVAQYGQWDGYPSAAGVTILADLKNTDPNELRKKVNKAQIISDEAVKDKWIECGAKPDLGYVSTKVTNKIKEKYPSLYRDIGYRIIGHILRSKEPILLQLNVEFAGNSLFCEWAYVVDLDKNTLEVYRGSNNEGKIDKNERFAFLNNQSKPHQGENQYYPITLFKSWSLDNLPSEDEMEALEKKGS